MPIQLIMLCRFEDEKEWKQITNPHPHELKNAGRILQNSFNEYVEFKNCGVIYRVERFATQESEGEPK